MHSHPPHLRYAFNNASNRHTWRDGSIEVTHDEVPGSIFSSLQTLKFDSFDRLARTNGARRWSTRSRTLAVRAFIPSSLNLREIHSTFQRSSLQRSNKERLYETVPTLKPLLRPQFFLKDHYAICQAVRSLQQGSIRPIVSNRFIDAYETLIDIRSSFLLWYALASPSLRFDAHFP